MLKLPFLSETIHSTKWGEAQSKPAEKVVTNTSKYKLIDLNKTQKHGQLLLLMTHKNWANSVVPKIEGK